MAKVRLSTKTRQRKPQNAPVQTPKRKLNLMAIGETVKAVARRVIHIGSYSALYPTAVLNMAGSPSPVIAVCNVGFVVGAAAFIDYGMLLVKQGDKLGRWVLLLGCVFIAVNVVNAGSNMAHLTGAVHDQAQGAMDRRGLLRDQHADIKRDIATNEERRAKQVAIADERTVETIEHDAGELINTNRKVYEASGQCKSINPKSTAQKELCGKVEKLEGVKSAAAERDRLTADRGKLDTRKAVIESQMAASGDTPTSVDSFGDSLKSVAPVFGVELSDTRAHAMTPLKGWFWAGALEILSAFAPLVLGGLLSHLIGLGAQPTRAEKKTGRKTVSKPQDGSKNEQSSQDGENTAQSIAQETVMQTVLPVTVCTFRDEKLGTTDPNLNKRILSSDVYASYEGYCEEKGVEPLNQTAFGRAMTKEAHIEKQKIGGAVYYLNVSFKRGALYAVK